MRRGFYKGRVELLKNLSVFLCKNICKNTVFGVVFAKKGEKEGIKKRFSLEKIPFLRPFLLEKY